MEPARGVEPPTRGLQNRCTAVVRRRRRADNGSGGWNRTSIERVRAASPAIGGPRIETEAPARGFEPRQRASKTRALAIRRRRNIRSAGYGSRTHLADLEDRCACRYANPARVPCRRRGLEPVPNGLKVRCSATRATTAKVGAEGIEPSSDGLRIRCPAIRRRTRDAGSPCTREPAFRFLAATIRFSKNAI